MGIAERFATIMKANINDLLETGGPLKNFDELLGELKGAVGEAEQETSVLEAAEKRAKEAYEAAVAKIKEQQEAAKRALIAGNQGDARRSLAEKVQLEQKVGGLEAAYKTAKENADKMRAMRDQMAVMLQAKQAEIDAVAERYEMAAYKEKIDDAVEAELAELKKSLKL
jgi:phage shock protein A